MSQYQSSSQNQPNNQYQPNPQWQNQYGQQYGPQPGTYFPQPAQKKGRSVGMFFLGLGIGVFVMLFVLLGVLLSKRGTAASYETKALTQEQAQILVQKVDLLVQTIDERYYEDVDTEVLLDGAYHGLTQAMGDKYAAYFNAEEYQEFMTDNSGIFVGIGVSVTLDEEYGGAHVEEVYQNGGAYDAGLQYGDVIIRADGVDLRELTLDELVRYIRGG